MPKPLPLDAGLVSTGISMLASGGMDVVWLKLFVLFRFARIDRSHIESQQPSFEIQANMSVPIV